MAAIRATFETPSPGARLIRFARTSGHNCRRATRRRPVVSGPRPPCRRLFPGHGRRHGARRLSHRNLRALRSPDQDLELHRLTKDEHGARYRLRPDRAEQLRRRFGVSSPATSVTSVTSAAKETSAENHRLWAENGDPDVTDLPDLTQGEAAILDDAAAMDFPFGRNRA